MFKMLQEQQIQKFIERHIYSPVGILGCRPGVKLKENYTHGCTWRQSSRQIFVVTNEEMNKQKKHIKLLRQNGCV